MCYDDSNGLTKKKNGLDCEKWTIACCLSSSVNSVTGACKSEFYVWVKWRKWKPKQHFINKMPDTQSLWNVNDRESVDTIRTTAAKLLLPLPTDFANNFLFFGVSVYAAALYQFLALRKFSILWSESSRSSLVCVSISFKVKCETEMDNLKLQMFRNPSTFNS